jgi:ABC-type amino acid transport substrate-binding protein
LLEPANRGHCHALPAILSFVAIAATLFAGGRRCPATAQTLVEEGRGQLACGVSRYRRLLAMDEGTKWSGFDVDFAAPLPPRFSATAAGSLRPAVGGGAFQALKSGRWSAVAQPTGR